VKAIKILQDQHREVEGLFEAFEKEEDARKKMAIFMEIADALAAHATIEEKVFYPGVKTDDTEELLREAVEEHLSVKRIISDLLEMDAEDEQFEAKVTALQEQVEHHVKEEETDLFTKVRKAMEDEELEEMGAQMENLMAELMAEGEPSKNVPMETGEAAPV
jgi:hemerythrin superfamily protein